MQAKKLILFAVIGWLVAPAVAAPLDDDTRDAAAREQFRAAYAAAALGLDTEDDDALRGYVLYPYLRAARLQRALEQSSGAWDDADAATAAFIAEFGDAPVAQALRRAWLASLAQRESWQAFLAHYEDSAATPALECQRLNARIALNDPLTFEAIRARWLTGRRLPSECEPAFQWLRAQGELPDELVAQRVALLLDNGQAAFARVIAARLPPQAAAPLLERADFVAEPASALDAFVHDTKRDVPADVVREAWSRLARNAPKEALTRFDSLRERLPASEAEGLALALALGLSWDRRPEALDYFARVSRSGLDDASLEWRARAAMWSDDWDLVRASIAAMSSAQQADWAWRYWTARAAEQRDEGAGVAALYAAAEGGDNYYSALAAARRGERVVPRLEPLPLDADAVEAVAGLDTFRRVRELTLAGLRELATYEWHYGYRALSDVQQLQAIHLAARWGIYDIAVAMATRHGHFNDYALLYPRPYTDDVAKAVEKTNVDRHMLYGVLRQESLFRPDATSSAGALGIAQLTHATARETARRWALPAPRREDLYDPVVGITIGAARLAELIERFDSQVPVALSAYNAGEAAAARWLPERAIDSDVWIENIPYNETRAYVRRVLWHSLVFEWLETGRAPSARDWLGKIEG
jgi:soluble lytic murein transglycosylase